MPLTHQPTIRSGFTFVEVIVAILVVSVALLALEGSAAVTLRELSDSRRETVATALAERARERTLGSKCAASTSTDSSTGVVLSSAASPHGTGTTIAQRTSFSTRFGDRSESYRLVGRCQ